MSHQAVIAPLPAHCFWRRAYIAKQESARGSAFIRYMRRHRRLVRCKGGWLMRSLYRLSVNNCCMKWVLIRQSGSTPCVHRPLNYMFFVQINCVVIDWLIIQSQILSPKKGRFLPLNTYLFTFIFVRKSQAIFATMDGLEISVSIWKSLR